jgi:hypothetical protein
VIAQDVAGPRPARPAKIYLRFTIITRKLALIVLQGLLYLPT